MRLAIFLLLVFSLASNARGGMVTIHFGGEVTDLDFGEFSDLPPISVGDPLIGSFTYDDSVIYSVESRSFLFSPPNSISMSVRVGGATFELDGTPLAGYLYADISLSESLPAPGHGGYSVQVPSAHDPAHSYLGYAQLAVPMAVPGSGVLRDAPIPELPENGGFFSFRAPADYEVSPERILPGIHPGGIPIFAIDPQNPRGPRIQVATLFQRVIASGSGFYGRLTSWQVPEPGGLASAILVLAFAVRPRSARRTD